MFILTFLKQGPTICMHRVCMYAYFYLHTHDFAHVYFDTYSHCFLMIFQISGSYNFTLFKNLILYFWTFICLSLKERGPLLLSFVLKKPYFPFFHTNYLINISPYVRTHTNLVCQYEKKKKIVMCLYIILIILLYNHEKNVHVFSYRFFWRGLF